MNATGAGSAGEYQSWDHLRADEANPRRWKPFAVQNIRVSLMGKWVFEKLSGAAVRRQPQEHQLFRTEQTGEDEYAGSDTLVREALQNSLDARCGHEPVRVRLALHDASEAPSAERLAYYFDRLRPALRGKDDSFDLHGASSQPCRFLVCEDFGTRGLEGDPELFHNPPAQRASDGERQDFFWFWRNIGLSGKTGDDLGRWGLGKTVYRAASAVGCMFGVTIRQSDGRRLLMGQAVLQVHQWDGNEYQPEGYWCAEQNADGVPLAIEDPSEIEQFCREWHLARRSEPGLSVVVPFIPEQLQAKHLLQAVAVHFFSRIVRRELIVEVVFPDGHTETLDDQTIDQTCGRLAWDGPKRTKRHMAPPIEFARRTLRVTQFVETRLLGQDRVPELTEQSFDDHALQRARRTFSEGALTSVRVHLWLPRRDGRGARGQLDVHLQRVSDARRCDSYYVREGMTITKINSRAAQRGVQALVNVEPGPLANLLGDTEGPAHEDWDKSAERPNREWKAWKGRVQFVRGIVDRLVEVLTPPATEPDFDLLSKFFSLEQTGGPQRGKKTGREHAEPSAPPTIESAPKWFEIDAREGGFTIRRVAGVPMPPKAALKVSVAYDLPQGDPLRHWSPLDFRIGNGDGALEPRGKGVRAELLHGNVVRLYDLADQFRFSVVGFDQHRDLFIRVDDVSDLGEAAE